MGTTQSASDESRIRDLQAEADPYYRDHARQAPMAMNGEGPDAYSARLGAGLQHHSATWGKVDLAGLPPSVVTLAKQRIFEDSRKEAESPSNVPDGELRGITRADAAGRNATQFYGSVDAWLGDFKLPKRFATIPEPDRRKVR